MTAAGRLLLASVALVSLACGPKALPPVAQKPMDVQKTSTPVIADASASPVTFERIAAFPPPGWQIPRQVTVSPSGKLVTYLQAEKGGETMALFAFSLETHEHSVLVRASDIVASDRPMSREEELRRERQRKRIQGVTGYAWADHADVMLLPLGGNVYVRTPDGTIKQLTDSDAPEIDPKICADGSKVAFARGPELFVVDVASGKETQLTKGAPKDVTRGQSDFNGQEEFNEPSGLWWSPGCDRVAYLEVDEGAVAKIPVMGYRDGADLQHHRYPRTGETNPKTKLGVLDLKTKKTSWIAMPAADGFDAADQYLGRLTFSHDGQHVYFQRLSRSQQRLALVRADVKSGQAEHLVEESAPTWLDMTQVRTLRDGTLLWTARRDGHLHIETRSAIDGSLLRTLTAGAWDVSHIVAVDEAGSRVLFIGNKDATLDRQLYAAKLDGSGIERLSHDDGVHDVSGPRPHHGWVDIHSSTTRLPKASIHDATGKAIGEIPVKLDPDLDQLKLRSPKLVRIEGTKDAPPLHGALLEPRNMQAGVKYPVIVMVYGGPGVQTVSNSYNPLLLWQHLADRGFVVWQVDNRGSTGRGHAFEAPLHKKMGSVELDDQLRGLDYLSSLPFVDASRVGIYGHSYGGYLAALAMLKAPDRFKVGVSGSPVTDWKYYDTGYTERYMGTPQNNATGYQGSSLIPLAGKLERKLLIIHALMDENVHFEHTAAFIDALVAADRDFDLLVFPGERHGYRSPKARQYAYRRVVDYFAANL